ncbi:uncharacterized protein [Dysidea avara]|uniref:uncharacterized protein n=1 Tax=Dysidea avara TaxID=196820 RepID=UPI00331AF80D
MSSAEVFTTVPLACFMMMMCGFATNTDSDYIPYNVKCAVSSMDDSQHVLNVSWMIRRETNVRRFDVNCTCPEAGYKAEKKHFDHCPDDIPPPCHHNIIMEFSSPVCYDQCHCKVRTIKREIDSATNLSDISTCYIGPKVPKRPPVIISSDIRNKDGRSVPVIFQLPKTSLYYCDEVSNIKRIIANITDHQGSYQHLAEKYSFSNVTARTFSFILQLNSSALWKSFTFSLSLKNSFGASPFSDQVSVRGAVNGDISRDDYQFGYNVVTINSTSRSLHLYWTITNATWGLLDSHFIRGFNYTVQQLDNGEYYTTTVTTNLTVIVTLNSSNWYMMIGRILTNDKDSWGPEPVYLYLPPSYTPLSGSSSTTTSNEGKGVMFTLLGTTVLFAVLSLILTIVISVQCYKIITDDDDDSSGVYQIDCTSSITEFSQDKSEVENSKLPVPRNDDDDDKTITKEKDDSALSDNDMVTTGDNSAVEKLSISKSYTDIDGDTSRADTDSVLNNSTKLHVNETEV